MKSSDDLGSSARSLLARASDDPVRVAAEAEELTRQASAVGNDGALAMSLRALGLARATLLEMEQAATALEKARLAAKRSDDSVLIGEVDMTYAAVLAWMGHQRSADIAIDRAVSGLRGIPQARALVQRGTMSYRSGRFRAALADFQKAHPVLERHDDQDWLSRLYNNRGLVHGFMGDLVTAQRDLEESLAIDRSLGNASSAAQAIVNIGWLAARAGDIPLALDRFDVAERLFGELGYPAWELWAARCDALISAHLADEALELATAAVKALSDTSHATGHAEALLRLARAAQMADDLDVALAAARHAVREFDEQGRSGWAVYAEYLALRVEAEKGLVDQSHLRVIEGVAGRLEATGFRQPALHARLLAGKLAAQTGDLEDSKRQLAMAAAARDSGPADLRVQAWLAEAHLRLAAGDRRGVDRAAVAGLGVVDTYQAMLGASDARVAIAGHASELAAMGLRIAKDSRQPRRLFRWMERTRAGSLRFPLVSPPDDRELVADLTELRELEARLREVERAEDEVAQLQRRRIRVQERIRSRSLATRGASSAVPSAPKAEEVFESLRDRTMVEYGRIDGVLHAVVLHGNRVRHHELGDSTRVLAELDSLRLSVRRILAGHASEASIAAARQLIDASRTRLDANLFEALSLPDGELIIVPPGDYHALPWGLLPTVAGRPFSIVPSAALWLARADRRRHSGEVVLVGGPRLDEAKTEVDRLRKIYPDALRFTPGRAKVEPVLGALEGSGLAHVASHGTFRADNPLFSALELTDGPLTVYDIERLDRLPQTMVLSACDAGLPAERPGNEIMGLVAALLAAGTRTVVASTGLVPDTSGTLRLMTSFHRHLAAGSRPARALATAQASIDPLSPEGLAAASFVCFGRS